MTRHPINRNGAQRLRGRRGPSPTRGSQLTVDQHQRLADLRPRMDDTLDEVLDDDAMQFPFLERYVEFQASLAAT